MKKLNLFLVALVCPVLLSATDIKIENDYFSHNSRSRDNREPHVVFTVSWKNAWRNGKNHDAAWIFMKFVNDGGGYRHIYLNPNDIEIIDDGPVAPIVQVSEDKTGMFIYPASNYRGDVSWRIKMKVDSSTFIRFNPGSAKLKTSAIEMVYIPEGGFTLGDPDERALSFSSFFKSDASGNPDGLYKITSEDQEIKVGPERGALYYTSLHKPYQGDMTGTVPASFPNGYSAFYIMKYETSQGQYTDFLNTLSGGQSQMRAPHGGKGYYKYRGTIKIKDDKFYAGKPARPANYITWDDGAAFADWAGLRPMTELEFTKASRGPGEPIPHEFPWNTDSKEQILRRVNLEGDLVLLNGLDESQLNDQNRDQFGASYYWVMDLAGSLWEKCVTIGHDIGRAYKGSHGDGNLTGYGKANNADWPKGIDEEGGYGYRGGGFYYNGGSNTEFNPHSPIAYRPFGSWAGGTRSVAYSQRYVRTAPKR